MTAITIPAEALKILEGILADPAKLEAVLGDVEKLDFRGLVVSFRAGNVDGVLESTESFLSFLSLFLPQAQVASYVVLFLLFANKTREVGLWHPGEESDPAEQWRDAQDHENRGR